MTNGNKTLNIQYRFLAQKDFPELYKTNLEAFSDYLVPLQMTKGQFENHLAQNAVDINLSVGAFSKDQLIGYTLNGFGVWNGKQTAYDAGTGVIAEYRNKGVGKSLFQFLLPKLKKHGIEQMLLEVLTNNKKAIHLYRKLGFRKHRKLEFFEQTKSIEVNVKDGIQIRQIEKATWDDLKTFWDRNTSWQFSNESTQRKLVPTKFFSAYLEDKCIGYSILSPKSGIISQIAVDKEYRRKKIASRLLAEMQSKTKNKKHLSFCNVDSSLESLISFTKSLDFKPTISQFEMILKL